ncbi:flagellar basal body P-ring formation chaperone FlgA [Pseudoduganella chitinolytica]|uniref:Flagellar basal body P-ring formation chaperone FlgA n=1 Tax=Pseudoduganella chitinolytica TaxID=34070 RepID=A0ABY8BDN2_9BURK|nr:flagellar basal body P-ring formation chaperone FlgA [Pseudoduganella chitinolytica]WEF32842.1 flagellar basal body P-ring formation chaperone FlgA [Pseudoduganella chitinolytica]
MSWKLALAPLALWAGCALAQGATVALDLRAAATVRGKDVLLADVAAIEGADARQRQALGAVRLGPAPLVGYAQDFSRAAIEAAVLARPLAAGLVLDWRGAARVIVRRAGTLVAGSELADVARKGLAARYGREYDEIELTPVGTVTDVQVADGRLELRPRETAGPLRPRTTAWIDVLVDGAVYRSVALPMQAKAWRTVALARRSLPVDAQVGADDVRLVRQEVLALAGQPAAAPAVGEHWRLRTAVAEGEVLLREQLVPTGAIRRGDRVTLLVTAGAIRIESAAVAQEDGVAGAVLRVLPAGGEAVVKARVIGTHLVAMDEN